MKCTNGHSLTYSESNGTWWHEKDGPGWSDCTAHVDCPHTDVAEWGVGDASCASGTRMFRECRTCHTPLGDYPLPALHQQPPPDQRRPRPGEHHQPGPGHHPSRERS